jgi:hypothetical protein
VYELIAEGHLTPVRLPVKRTPFRAEDNPGSRGGPIRTIKELDRIAVEMIERGASRSGVRGVPQEERLEDLE